MINFIVVDDEKYFIDEVGNIVDCIMMKNTFDYKTYTFNDFDKEFMLFIKNSVKRSSTIWIICQSRVLPNCFLKKYLPDNFLAHRQYGFSR